MVRLASLWAEEEPDQKHGLLSRVFEEEPVSLDVFIQDQKYMGQDWMLSPVQASAVRHIERIYMPDLYPLMAEEFGGYWAEPIRMTNLISLQWGKGCISPDQEVFSATDGRWRRIADITDSFAVQAVVEVNPDGDTTHTHGQPVFQNGTHSVAAQASAPFKRGYGRMLKVTTTSGATITVYEGHLFASWRDHDLPYKNRYRAAVPAWTAAGALQPGHRIAMMARLDVQEPKALDPREVELVGYWIGDGSMPTRSSTSWGLYVDTAAIDLIQRYVSLVESYDGIRAKVETMQSGAFRIRATGRKIGRYGAQPLLDIIRKYGLYGSRAWDKRIPPEFFSLPGDQLTILLSALWDTDGSIYLKKSGSSVTPVLSYSSVSEGLALDVQRLLLRLGVVSRITSKTPRYTYKGEHRTGRTAYTVSVSSGVDAKRLAQALSLHGEKEELRFALADMELGRVQQVREGDIYWDTVHSVEEMGDGDYWDLNVPEAGSYTAGSGAFLSSNSGKDHVCRVASLRVAYLLLCLKSPQKYYRMPEDDSIHLLNIAANSGQANRAFFTPMTKQVRRGWFADRAEPKRDTITYAKNVEAVSGHSDAEGQEGLNIMLGVADEIDAFRAKDEMVGQGKRAREASTSAESILKMLKGSASTRFPESYKRVAISYPRYEGSTIQLQTKEAEADIKEMGDASIYFNSGPLATWDVNPRVKGKESFASDYRKNPEEAAAMYECRPSKSADPYFRTPDIFREAVYRDTEPLAVSYELKRVRSQITGNTTDNWEPVWHFASDFQPVAGARYAMHADLAIRGDRAGIAMSHVEKWTQKFAEGYDEEGLPIAYTLDVPTVKVDFVTAFEADPTARPQREIQIQWARMLAFELIRRGFYITRFTFDNFQSADSMQALQRQGIESLRVSADLTDEVWKNLRDLASDGRLRIPKNELLQNELEGLTRVKGRVDHPHGGCFVGDTRIPLLDGTFPQISELAGQQVWVYSADSDGKIKPGLARGRMTKSTTELVDVILDNGSVTRCTPEHLWMLRDGSYREAQALRPGIDRLMPITFNWPVNGGYVRVTDKDGLRTLGHHMVAEHMAGRVRQQHEVVHHKNENKTDNRPENLELLTHVQHVTHHAGEFWEGKQQAFRDGYDRWLASPEKDVMYARRRSARHRGDVTLDAILTAIRDGAGNRAEAARLLNCDWNVVQSRLRAENMTFERAQALVNNNHKVRAVVRVSLAEPVPVYDLEVDDWSNFALSGGVFVHNSKDMADALACSVTGAIATGGEEDADGNSVDVGSNVFTVGEALAPLFGQDEVDWMNVPDLPAGLSKGLELYGY